MDGSKERKGKERKGKRVGRYIALDENGGKRMLYPNQEGEVRNR
jgi:hypothetical protein